MRRQESRDAEYRGAGIESQIKGSVASAGRNSTGASVCLLLLNFASDVFLFISVSLQDVVFPLTLRLHSKSVYSQNNGNLFFNRICANFDCKTFLYYVFCFVFFTPVSQCFSRSCDSAR